MHDLPLLGFATPCFMPGRNVSVRRGRRWLNVPMAWIVPAAGTSPVAVALQARLCRFDTLCEGDLVDEHDPACRHPAGLLAVLQAIYPGFTADEEVCVLGFELPAAFAANGSLVP